MDKETSSPAASTTMEAPAPRAPSEAEPDPLAAAAAGILSHMNQDHADTLLAYARSLAGAPDATAAVMTSVDRHGFEVRATTPAGERLLRLSFDPPVTTTDEVRRAMIALAREARERSAGRGDP